MYRFTVPALIAIDAIFCLLRITHEIDTPLLKCPVGLVSAHSTATPPVVVLECVSLPYILSNMNASVKLRVGLPSVATPPFTFECGVHADTLNVNEHIPPLMRVHRVDAS
jgi:hypothetical protein